MCSVLKRGHSRHSPADFSKYASDQDEIDDKLIVLKRRYTRKLESVGEYTSSETQSFKNQHAKSTKSTIQSLELSSKNHLKDLVDNLPFVVESNEIATEDLAGISFVGAAKPIEGGMSGERANRKEGQLKNLAHPVVKIAKDNDVIVDFCSGGGHVGLALAALLPRCEIVLVENKEESLKRARRRVRDGNFTNVTLVQSNLSQWNSHFDIGLALHACGSATDQV